MKLGTFVYIVFIYNFWVSYNIHIVKQDIKVGSGKALTIKGDPEFDRICSSILTTYGNLGIDSFDLYGNCIGSFNYLGADDLELEKESPLCFVNVVNVFCRYKILESGKNCKNDFHNLKQLILSTLKGCFKKEKGYVCPSLNKESYLVRNSTEFCKGMEQAHVEEEGSSVNYSLPGRRQRESCEDLVSLFNVCIKTDNLLFPESNYQRCFDESNLIYSCNRLESFTEKEQKLCRSYLLPVLAKDAVEKRLISTTHNFCDNFQHKISDEYDNFIKNKISEKNKFQKILKKKNSELANIDRTLNNTDYLTSRVQGLKNNWFEFYPELSAVFRQRSNVTYVEYTQLSKMRKLFDELFPFTANVDEITKRVKEKDFVNFLASVEVYFRKIDNYFDGLEKITKTFGEVLKSNRNITYFSGADETQGKFMLEQQLQYEEVVAFQNEFSGVSQYIKNFLTFTLSGLKKILKEKMQEKSDLTETIKKDEKMIQAITKKKQKLSDVD